ncbi:uncharacterized protein LOC127239562 [Andrographis paniculata]|uniref:uncharacterized protein LOC127239562 n=1 Tax=Andrographis paniculata TaxID=175694 RepID=UPI0021E82AD4|nr:uncharacterized protein LOC127239562 [Andrographis paniculata]
MSPSFSSGSVGPTSAKPTVQPTPTSAKPPPMISQEVDPTKRQSPPSQPMIGRKEAPTKRQSLPTSLKDPKPSTSKPAAARVSSDNEATASQMGRLPYVASDSSILNEEPIAPPASASAAVASVAIASAAAASIAAAPNAAAPIDRDVLGAAVQVAPDVPTAAAPGAADPRAADPVPEAARREEEPAAAQPRGLLHELEEISSSDSETSVNLGPRSAPQRPFAAAEESAVAAPAARVPRPTTLLSPSVTMVHPEGHLDLAPLSAIPIFRRTFRPYSLRLRPILHRLMERLAELRNDILLARLLSAEPSQPSSDQISPEASLAKTRESLQQAAGRLDELLSARRKRQNGGRFVKNNLSLRATWPTNSA